MGSTTCPPAAQGYSRGELQIEIEADLESACFESSERCIYRAPEKLRRRNEEAYTPRVVSIGPFHHGCPRYEAMEKTKRNCLKAFIQRRTPKISIEECLQAAEGLEEPARSCYAEPIPLSRAEFIKMLMLDGIFLIEFFFLWGEREMRDSNDPIYGRPWMCNDVLRDIYLLENQLPLFVIKSLFEIGSERNERDWVKFLGKAIDLHDYPQEQTDQIKHILDGVRLCLSPRTQYMPDRIKHIHDRVPLCPLWSIRRVQQPVDSELNQGMPTATAMSEAGVEGMCTATAMSEAGVEGMCTATAMSAAGFEGMPTATAMSAAGFEGMPTATAMSEAGVEGMCTATAMSAAGFEGMPTATAMSAAGFEGMPTATAMSAAGFEGMPTATAMSEAGVEGMCTATAMSAAGFEGMPTATAMSAAGFEGMPTATAMSEAGVEFKRKTSKLLDIEYANGVLQIPRLTIVDGTESSFRNLILWEQCHYRPDVSYFTDYVVLMDNLINTTEDVDLLVREEIVVNWLGESKAVANLFNDACKDIIIDKRGFYYGMRNDLIAHCKRRRNRWRATLMRDYFGNPWVTFSVIGGVMLLLLTILQTIFSGLSL